MLLPDRGVGKWHRTVLLCLAGTAGRQHYRLISEGVAVPSMPPEACESGSFVQVADDPVEAGDPSRFYGSGVTRPRGQPDAPFPTGSSCLKEGKRRIELCHSVQVECRCNTFWSARPGGRSGVPEPDMVILVPFGAALLAVAMRRKGVTTRSTGSGTTVTSTSSIPSSRYRVSQRVQGGTRSVSVISGLGFDCLPTLVANTEDSGRHEYETGRLGYG